jgi:hypothetical protein
MGASGGSDLVAARRIQLATLAFQSFQPGKFQWFSAVQFRKCCPQHFFSSPATRLSCNHEKRVNVILSPSTTLSMTLRYSLDTGGLERLEHERSELEPLEPLF